MHCGQGRVYDGNHDNQCAKRPSRKRTPSAPSDRRSDPGAWMYAVSRLSIPYGLKQENAPQA